jgi:hypothetical protein
MRGRWRIFFVVAGFMFVGFSIAALIGMPLVESAHRGDGPALLERAMDARHQHSADFYQAKFVRLGLLACVASLAALGLVLIATSPWFFRRFVGLATAQSLAFIRILICTILVVDTLTIDLGDAALFPPSVRLPMGVVHVISMLPLGLDALNSSENGLRVWQALTAACLIFGALGYRTRYVIPAAFALYMIQGGIIRQYDRLFHTGLTPLYVLAVLCVLPSGDAWSLDRRRRIRRGLPVVPDDAMLPIYGWARYICWIPVVLVYVEAGLTKLVRVGPMWWKASNMRAIILRDSVERAELRWVFIPQILKLPDFVFDLLGILTLTIEIGFFIVLLSTAARYLLPAMVAGMHLGIYLLQGLRFFDLMFLQLIFFNGPAIVARMARWVPHALAERIRRTFGADAAGERAPLGPAITPRVRWGYPLASCAIVLVMLGVWSRQIEFYPFSSMNLYASYNGTSVITHYRVVARYPGGERERIYLQQVVDLLERTNFRQSIARGFHPPSHPEGRMAREYVRACGEAHNRANPHEPITAIEVQRWRWDYRAQPHGPDGEFGQIVDSYVVPITARDRYGSAG